MPSLHETVTESFCRWEMNGRGWTVYPHSIHPEPPFSPFEPSPPSLAAKDDGHRPTLISSLFERIGRGLGANTPEQLTDAPQPENAPDAFRRGEVVELQAFLPPQVNIPSEAVESFLFSLRLCKEPVSFELIGANQAVAVQFVCGFQDVGLVKRQLQSHFPNAVFREKFRALETALSRPEDSISLVVELGLERQFMISLKPTTKEPFVGIIGVLSSLAPGEVAMIQTVFQPTVAEWAEEILAAVCYADGSPRFVNAPDLASGAREKVSRPLYAAVVRLLVSAPTEERLLEISRELASSLTVYSQPGANRLVPLHNQDYPYEAHLEDVLLRQTRRSGMILNSAELMGFVHLPSPQVRANALQREVGKTKAAPRAVTETPGVRIGTNVHGADSTSVWLSPEQRLRHMHIIGASGTGKSTLLLNLITQDLEAGEGLAVLDPHGDLVDRVLELMPSNRTNDVILLDPSDEEYSVGFNILSAHSELEKNLIASDLVSVFARLSTSWGDQMGSVLNNAILAFLESARQGTLADLRRFLIDPQFRKEFLKTVQDPEVVYYWEHGFPQLTGNRSIGPIITRLETFLSPKSIRYMVSQPENLLDFRHIMDSGKICLAKLSQGLLGKENSYLLGSLLISKFQQLAMARQAQAAGNRRPFWVYVDEFQNFITPSMAEILTGARKYGVGLVLAHQDLRQLQANPDVASAVLANPFTRIVFRVGDDDARKLSEGFGFFEAPDLQNLDVGSCIGRVERRDYDFNLRIAPPVTPDAAEAQVRRQEVISASRKQYGRPRAAIQASLAQALYKADPGPCTPTPPRESPRAPAPPPGPVHGTAEALPPPKDSPCKGAQTEKKPPRIDRPRVSGKGGAQHRAIQKRIKEAAEARGFRGTMEKSIPGTSETVDLVLERGDEIIACEISITTTIDHEVGNITKCLDAGFAALALICPEKNRLQEMASAVIASMGANFAERVRYFTPDEFISHIQALAPPTSEQTALRRGYKIRRTIRKLTPEEQKAREEAAIRSIAEAMRVNPAPPR